MAKILLLGDPHLKISKFNQSVELLRWFNTLAEEYKPDFVVNLGDTFDTHAVLRSELLTEFKKHVLECPVPYLYVLGNHDMFKPNDSSYHALQAFDIPHMRVIDKPTDIDGISYIPYIHDFTKFPVETQPICIAHQTFVGVDYGYYRPDVGADADKCNAEIIISGHVHKRQSFGKVFYPGTALADNLNDVDQIKGVDIFDTDTYEFTFIQSPFPAYKSLSYVVGGDYLIENMHDDIENSINDKDHWIVKIEGPKPEIVEYMKSRKWLALQKNANIRIKPNFISGNKIERVKIGSVNIDGVINEYIDNVYTGSLDRDMLKLLSSRFINKSKKSTV